MNCKGMKTALSSILLECVSAVAGADAVAEKVAASPEMAWIPGGRDLLPAIPGSTVRIAVSFSPIISLEENA
jgi:hypothetical protein